MTPNPTRATRGTVDRVYPNNAGQTVAIVFWDGSKKPDQLTTLTDPRKGQPVYREPDGTIRQN